MNLNLLKIFVTVEQLQSISLAAEALNMSQPAVSQSLKKLETQLGENIYVRKGRGIEITERGRAIASQCSQGIELIEGVFNQSRTLYAYCDESLLYQLTGIKGLVFKLVPFDQESILADLRSQRIDLAINHVTTTDPSFIAEEIYKEPLVVICREGHPAVVDKQISFEQYMEAQHIAYKPKRDGLRLIELVTNKRLEHRDEVVEVSSSSSMCMLASQSDYFGVIGASLANHWASRLNLQTLPMPMPYKHISVQMIYHRRHLHDPVHKKMRDTIKSRLPN
jgi:DNA-binding transcriptional LysR family regulator